MTTFAVTGAAGFIGSHLAERLIADGHAVLCLDSFTDYYDPRRKRLNASELDVLEVDLAHDRLEGILDGVECVFHLAGQPGVRSFGPVFADYLSRNVLATQRLFEAAAPLGIKVVYASSSSVYGDVAVFPTPEHAAPAPRSPYGITKLACEQLAGAYAAGRGLDAVGLRYFTVYGPRQRPDMAFARVVEALALDAPFAVYGDGLQRRSFTFVADAVDATIRAAAAPGGRIYNVGGGEEASLRDAIAVLERNAGRRLRIRFEAAATGDVRRTGADTRLIEAELGWRPQTSLEDGLRLHWEWASSAMLEVSHA